MGKHKETVTMMEELARKELPKVVRHTPPPRKRTLGGYVQRPVRADYDQGDVNE